MSDLIKATNVGDSWTDCTGAKATLVLLDADRTIVRRKASTGWPTFSVTFNDGRPPVSRLLSLSKALSC